MGLKINEYSLERLVFGDDDYYDIDYFDGTTYQSAKILGSVIKAGISAGITPSNIYNSNGQLDANRSVDGALNELDINHLTKFIVQSVSNTKDNVVFSVDASLENPFNSFIIKDDATGDEMFAVKRGEVWINGLYKLPNNTGNADQVLKTNGLGVTSWEDPASGDNLYNTDDALTSDRSVNGDGLTITWDKFKKIWHYLDDKDDDGLLWKFLIWGSENLDEQDPQRRLFAVISEFKGKAKEILSVWRQQVWINNLYSLPNSSGAIGDVMQLTGLQTASWVTPPEVKGTFSYSGTFVNVGKTGAGSSVIGGTTADFGTIKASSADHVGFIMAPRDMVINTFGFQWASKDSITSAAGSNKNLFFRLSTCPINNNPMDANNWSTNYGFQTLLTTDLPAPQWPGFQEYPLNKLQIITAGTLVAVTLFTDANFSNTNEEANCTLTFLPV